MVDDIRVPDKAPKVTVFDDGSYCVDESVEGSVFEKVLDNPLASELDDSKFANDEGQRAVVEKVEKVMAQIGAGSGLGSDVYSSAQKLITFSPETKKYIAQIPSAGKALAVAVHADYVESTCLRMVEILKKRGFLAKDFVLPKDFRFGLEFSILDEHLQLGTAVDGKRAELFAGVMKGAKLEETSEVKRTSLDKLAGRNRGVPK